MEHVAFSRNGAVTIPPSSGILPRMRGRKSKPPDDSAPNRIREWRLARGLTIEELAERMQSKSQTVHRHETGNNEMTLKSLQRYADVLGVRTEELLPNSQRVPAMLKALNDLGQRLTPTERAQLVRLGTALAQSDPIDDDASHTN